MPPVPPTERARAAPRHRLLVPCSPRRYLIAGALVACTRAVPAEPPTPAPASTLLDAAPPVAAPTTTASAPALLDAGAPPWVPDPAAIAGPSLLTWEPGRPIWWAAPRSAAARPARLVAHLHGMCGPPSYACGRWIAAGTARGVMVCPTGNAQCGDSPFGPPSWEGPSWPELVTTMDHDLEAAIAKVSAKTALDREGAVLTGYSRGGFAVPEIARRHPGRWPYLVVIEASAPMTAAGLRASGVRAVALVAGELGTERAGMTRLVERLAGEGLPARLFLMRRTGHPYSDDMEFVMHQAIESLFAADPP